MKLLKQLSVIAGFSIIGEIISYLLKELLDIFIPGSLIGMIILFILSSASSNWAGIQEAHRNVCGRSYWYFHRCLLHVKASLNICELLWDQRWSYQDVSHKSWHCSWHTGSCLLRISEWKSRGHAGCTLCFWGK